MSTRIGFQPSRSSGRSAGVLLAACLFFIATRLIWFAIVDDMALVSDSIAYDWSARSIAEGRGMVNRLGDPSAFWPVGYPALLALAYFVFPASPYTAMALGIGVSAITLVFAWLLFKELFGAWVAAWGTLVLAAYPPFLFHAPMVMSDTTAGCLVVMGVYFLVAHRPLLAGIAFGCCTLVRPQFAILPAMLLAGLALVDRQRFWAHVRSSAIVYCVVLAVVAPWALRNYLQLGAPALSTNGCYNLYIGHNPEQRWGANYPLPKRLQGIDIASHVPNEIAFDRALCGEALGHIRDDPGRSAKLALYKIYRFLRPDPTGLDMTGRAGVDLGQSKPVLQAIGAAIHLVILIAAVPLPLLWVYRRDMAGIVVAAPLLHGLLLSAAIFGEGRLQVPVLPFFVGSALYTVAYFLGRTANAGTTGQGMRDAV